MRGRRCGAGKTLAVALCAASATLALSAPARADDASLPPPSVPLPAAGMSAAIVPDEADDMPATSVPAPTEQSAASPSVAVATMVAEVQKSAANTVEEAVLAHPVAANEHVISPTRTEPVHAAQAAAQPTHRAPRTARFGWYRVRAPQYHAAVARAAHARRASPEQAALPRSWHTLVASPARPSNDGPICLLGSSICLDSCPLNQLDNVLQNGDWIASCILLPSLPESGSAGQPTVPATPPSAAPAPQYQCSDSQYHEVCCELALGLSLPVPLNCGAVSPVAVSEADAGFVSPAPTPPSPPAPAPPPIGSTGKPATAVARPPAPARESAPADQFGWELAGPQAGRATSGVARVESTSEPRPQTPAARVLAAAPTKPHPAPAHRPVPRPAAPRVHRTATPTRETAAPAATDTGSGSLLGWFLILAGVTMLAALATAAGLDDAAAAAVIAVRSRLRSRGLSGRRLRRARGGIRYRE